jgi:cytoskeletal protein RodZ
MDLGSELRTARERAGVSLSDLAARTRIPQRSLRAIEENDFASVPKGIFVRSFIRAYAREVGVDPDEAIAEFSSMTEPVPQDDDETQVGFIHEQTPPRSPAFDFSEARPRWSYAFIAAALLIGLVGFNRYASKNQPDTPAPVTAKADPARAAPATTVTANAGTAIGTPAGTEAPVATAGTGIQIEMRAQGLCWIRAVVDGQPAVERLMQPGETQMLSGRTDITVRVGDPAALSYSINGRTGEPLGLANEAVTVRFDTTGRATRVL